MRNYVLIAALAALAAGCSQREEAALSELPPMPAAPSSVASPASSSSAKTAEKPVSSIRQRLGPRQAFDAGVNIMMARDVCRLPAGDVAKFAAYSKWLVADDQEMKKAYVFGAKTTADFYKAAAEQRKLDEVEKQLCPGVKSMLATISRGIKTTPPPVGQVPITN